MEGPTATKAWQALYASDAAGAARSLNLSGEIEGAGRKGLLVHQGGCMLVCQSVTQPCGWVLHLPFVDWKWPC